MEYAPASVKKKKSYLEAHPDIHNEKRYLKINHKSRVNIMQAFPLRSKTHMTDK